MKKYNEYQEALNYLDWHCNVEHKEQQELLQELVNKETPMKVYVPENTDKVVYSMTVKCSKCNQSMGSLKPKNYCANCGQRIDWSDEE